MGARKPSLSIQTRGYPSLDNMILKWDRFDFSGRGSGGGKIYRVSKSLIPNAAYEPGMSRINQIGILMMSS
jgi:hypothetical protein